VTATEFRVHVGGLDLFVRDVGAGPPLVLVNGLGGHTAMWAPVERKLSGLRLVSYDSPGVGDSPAPLIPPSLRTLADVIEKLVNALSLTQVDVLGYSFGGAVAQQFAFRYPDRVRRLILVATLPGQGCIPGALTSLTAAFNPLRYYSPRYYARTIGTLAGGQARWDARFRERHGAERLAKRPHPLSYYAQIAALNSWSSLPWIDRIEAPTLVVTGDDDPLVPPANSFLIASRIRRARLVIAPGEGHLLLFDDNGVAHHAIQEFLTAPSVNQSSTWRSAMRVDEQTATSAIRARGWGPALWGPISGLLRHHLSPPGAITGLSDLRAPATMPPPGTNH
jgi:pimeloyl-ACP methyl ester carboxylesterase